MRAVSKRRRGRQAVLEKRAEKSVVSPSLEARFPILSRSSAHDWDWELMGVLLEIFYELKILRIGL